LRKAARWKQPPRIAGGWAPRASTVRRKPDANLFRAQGLAWRYRLLRDALTAAGEREEAGRIRRAIVDHWKTNLSGGDDAELYLSQ
jgi:hypothetical protein